ncbi:hypothetical protein F6R83_23715 [Citrobacter amalonaticus]|nr:hypothetical protein [Citrobacter amalonaticus]
MKNSANAPYGASLFCGGIVTKTFAQRSRIFLFRFWCCFSLYIGSLTAGKICSMIPTIVDKSVCKRV